MDTPDNSVDFLELPVVAALRSRSLPVVVVGDFLVVATVVAAASSRMVRFLIWRQSLSRWLPSG